MRKDLGAVALGKVQRLDHSLSFAFNHVYKREVYGEIFRTNLFTLISCSNLRVEEEFANIVFQ